MRVTCKLHALSSPFVDQCTLDNIHKLGRRLANNNTPLNCHRKYFQVGYNTHTSLRTWLHYSSAVFWTSESAHNTDELLLCVVRWTLQAIARGLHMMEQCSIGIAVAPRNRLLAFINTFKGRRVAVRITFWHEISLILLSPWSGAAGFCWQHQDCFSCWSKADSTGNIVVICSLHWNFVFSSMQWTVALHSALIAQGIFWIWWHAEMYSSTTWISSTSSCSFSCID